MDDISPIIVKIGKVILRYKWRYFSHNAFQISIDRNLFGRAAEALHGISSTENRPNSVSSLIIFLKTARIFFVLPVASTQIKVFRFLQGIFPAAYR
jgi:hypothetical protein